MATTELLTRDVGAHTPSIGPYSRDGWHHPGPALFYALALPYRLFGRDGAALTVGAVLINAVSVGAMGVLARRRGGTGLMLATLVGCGLLLQALGPTFLATPWNVYVTVLPYGVLLYLMWAVVRDERWALPWATVVTTFLMQTHVGYVALAFPLWLAAVAWTAGVAIADHRRARRSGEPAGDDIRDDADGGDEDRGGAPASDHGGGSEADERADPTVPSPRWGRLAPAVVTAAVAVVMWLPPVVEQVTHADGNMDEIVEWFRDPGEEARTLLAGWRVVADQYTVPPEWLVGPGSPVRRGRAGRGVRAGGPLPPGAGGRRHRGAVAAPGSGGAGAGRRLACRLGHRGGGDRPHGRPAVRLSPALGVGPRDARRRLRPVVRVGAGDRPRPRGRPAGGDRRRPGRPGRPGRW